MYHTVVNISTVEWSLYVQHSGHYMYRTFVTMYRKSGNYMYRTVVTVCTAQW